MITRRIRVQLLVFALVTLLTAWYGATRFLGVGSVLHPPYEVEMQVADPGGLYPRADVDLLGSRVGRVSELRAGPGRATTVVMLIDHDVTIPADVTGVVAAKSAIGEGYVQLEPRSADGPVLADGDVIPLADTVSPIRLDGLLAKVDALAASVPTDDLDTVLRESEVALRDLEPSFGRLVTSSGRLSDDALANIDDTTALLRDARTVLATQAEVGPQTVRGTHELAGVTRELRRLDPAFVRLYGSGLRASRGLTNLLADNQAMLPVLLDNLVTITTVARQRVPELRKTLVVFPWILENQVNTTRYCDDYDPQTGTPVQSTCHYDEDGLPIYTLHLAQQMDKSGSNPYQSCTRGYEGTNKTDPASRAKPDPNLQAHCGAPPSDSRSPNVRGAQNVTEPAFSRPGHRSGPGRTVVYDPTTGQVTDPSQSLQILGMQSPAPPPGPAGLSWLLTHLLEER